MPLSRGSLNFTNLRFFDLALKITWLNRVQYNDSGWAELAHIFSIHKILSFGDLFSKKLSENIQNRFWANVAYGAFKLLELSKPKNSLEFLNTPLWHNSHLRLQYRKEWLNKGYLCISDIVDTEGDLFTRQQLREKGLEVNFLEYFSLNHNIQNLRTPAQHMGGEYHGPKIPNILNIIGLLTKGCANIYKVLNSHEENVIRDVQLK